MTNTTGTTHAPLTAPLAQPKRPRKASALLLGTALGAIVGLGYGRGAYAQTVNQGTLSGPNSVTVTGTGSGTFETQDGFSVDTSTGGGVDIENDTYNLVEFIDTYNSSIATTAAGQRGVYVYGKDDVSISLSGQVSGRSVGVYGKSGYSGHVSITSTGTVNDDTGTAVYAYNFEDGSGAGATLTVNNAYGAFNGVAVYAYGDITVTTIQDGVVRGGVAGIEVENAGNQNGTGQSIEITANGTVTGETGNGIEASNKADGSLSIEANGPVTGGTNGIYADNNGTGALSITTTGTVTGTNDHGIYARASGVGAADATDLAGNSLEGVSLAINANNVTGTTTGIDADNRGSGSMTVTTTGLVKGIAEEGIRARNEASDTSDLLVDAYDVESGETGIEAYNNGGGALTVYANSVTADGIGIDAENRGSGALIIKTTGAVIGDGANNDDEGIRADNKSAGTDLTIEATTVTGYVGIDAKNYGSGELNIKTTGLVTGTGYQAIDAYNSSSGTNLIIEADDVSGGYEGIEATNNGSGALSITANGMVTGRSSYDGIYAKNSSNSNEDLTIVAHDVAGDDDGIEATQYGTGALSITANGNVTSEAGAAIDAQHEANGSVTIMATGDLTAKGNTLSSDAIFQAHTGNGDVNVTTDGLLDATQGDDGIDTDLTGDGDQVIVANGNIYADEEGINADHDGNGLFSITVNGNIEATDDEGIDADRANDGATGDTVINVNGNINSGDEAIHVDHPGDGLVDIDVTGNLVAEDVGIEVDHEGTGDIDIKVSGDIRSDNGKLDDDGVQADHRGNGNVFVETDGTILAGDDGIDATLEGEGNLTIISRGTIDAGGENFKPTSLVITDAAIEADHIGTGTLNILTSAQIEGARGIEAEHTGDGALSITASGDILGQGTTYGAGIYARASGVGVSDAVDLAGNSLEGVSLAVNANNVTGGTDGINAYNQGEGALRIMTSGTIKGISGDGLDVDNSGGASVTIETNGEVRSEDADGRGIKVFNFGASGSDVVISANDDVYSNYRGIEVISSAAGATRGAISITSTGSVTGEADAGVYAVSNGVGVAGAEDLDGNSLEGVSLAVTVNNVEGGTDGIFGIAAQNAEAFTITANGAVTGGTGDGIYAVNAGSEDTTITINEGGSVSTSSTDAGDWAIEANAPNGAITVNNFGTVTGRVNLSNSNTFTNSGTWDLAGTTSDFNATGDSTVVNDGLIIAAKDSAANEISAIDNIDTFQSNAGGTIRLADGTAGDLLLINGNGADGSVGIGAGTFVTNGGTIELDVDLSSTELPDFVGINGNLRLGDAPTALSINPVGDTTAAEAADSVQIVRVGTGNGETSDEGAFVLDGPVEVGVIAYSLSLGDCSDQADQNWYLCSSIGTTGAVFEAMPGVILNSFARTDTLQQRLGSRITGAGGTISTRGTGDLSVDQAAGPWMRTWGDFAYITPDTSSAGTSWDADSRGMEAGIGMLLGDHAEGSLIAGVNLRYGATYADLSTPNGTGSVNAKGLGVGASLTWFGNDGLYVDANGAMDVVSIDAASQGGGELLDGYNDAVYSASAEIGTRIELEGGTTLVPQAQLSWGKMDNGQFTDELGNVVSFADRETLTSRFGLTVEQAVTDPAWGSGKVYGFGNVLNDLSGSRSNSVAGINVTQSGTGDWVELGGGFSLQPSEGTNLFGQVSYREAFDGVSGEAIAVSAGWKMQW